MLAIKHSATCFYNSFLLETSDHKVISFREGLAFFIPLKEKALIIPISYHSILGKHELEGSFFFHSEHALDQISFEKSAELLISHYSTHKNDLYHRVINSIENMQYSLTKRKKDFIDIFHKKLSFKEAEQALFVGHAFHPAPKGRDGFTFEDSLLYSPEGAGAFALKWFWVSNEIVYEKHSSGFEDFNWMTNLLGKWPPKGFSAFPMHPWQAKKILSMNLIQDYMKKGLILEVQHEGSLWYPTTSMRTIFQAEAHYMLKFSLDVKLTNSVRHLMEHELIRGLQVHEVFSTPKGKEFTQYNSAFNVIFEPVYMAIKDPDGNPVQETYVMGRENPFQNESEENIVLAVLTQDHPEFKTTLIRDHIEQYAKINHFSLEKSACVWFKEFLNVAVNPLLNAQSEYGILLGAHQQNLILTLKDHLPVKSYFRDCHGTGYSKLGHTLFGNDVKILDLKNGNIFNDDTGNYLFSYYLIINSVFNVISSICRDGKLNEKTFIKAFRENLLALKAQNPADTSCLDYLLSQDKILHKGNFLCSLQNINESTTSNPLSIYVPITNPFSLQEL
jgi:N2-citryl-N6-acetyl-N6-hydroxylysine synthase